LTLRAAISSDIDTLRSIYGGRGCRRSGGYTHAELAQGLENFCRFLEPFGVKATLFMVGHDFTLPQNHGVIRATAAQGHEIANHTLTHAQGFRLLDAASMEAEIAGMEDACHAVIGERPVGFRSPGWNVGDNAIAILKRRGYVYDSSIHPMSLTPLFKFLHWWNTSSRSGGDRTTLGQLNYMFAPLTPYRTSPDALAQKGDGGLVELPLTVVPFVRAPFWATFLLATGFGLFEKSYRLIRSTRLPIQYTFHLSDFVDYTKPELADQVPNPGDGVYVPQALRVPLAKKLPLFQRAMDAIAADYEFCTLREWAKTVA
jgi:peptidoglycan/xylan/chitin deacetylase (PgdA/CDA1 family)